MKRKRSSSRRDKSEKREKKKNKKDKKARKAEKLMKKDRKTKNEFDSNQGLSIAYKPEKQDLSLKDTLKLNPSVIIEKKE